tara:strand:+ start:655 stop:912 length:258 start_codon:yes stop_codon:yes gene_type:complete
MIKQVCKNYNRIFFKKNTLGFHTVPYHLQYESRDFIFKLVDQPTAKKEINRKNYIREFNPYLKSNVSENLDNKLADFYRYKYSKR